MEGKCDFFKLLIFALIGVVALSSCAELRLPEKKIKTSAWEDRTSFVVKSSNDWDIVYKSDWVWTGGKTVDENGTATVSIRILKNHSFNSRVGIIKIRSNQKDYIIKVCQEGVRMKRESGDLGLSVEWDTCNLGAAKSNEAGNLYKWDEIHDYENNGYRLPTKDEQDELLTNCICVAGEKNGTYGEWLIAKNGNAIFFPTTGDLYKSKITGVDSCGCYWSSSKSRIFMYALIFGKNDYSHTHLTGFSYEHGFAVRLVRKK